MGGRAVAVKAPGAARGMAMAGMEGRDPFDIFSQWFAEAAGCGLDQPTAVALATADGAGRPSLRMVLLKGHGPEGFVFYTNLESRKGRELLANPRAALCFHWMPLARQVRVEGRAQPVSDDEADAYFASRDRASRIGAWASRQSRPMAGAHELEGHVARETLRFGLGHVPRPPYWSGFRIVPSAIEFWRARPFRLHERIAFTRDGAAAPWRVQRLFP